MSSPALPRTLRHAKSIYVVIAAATLIRLWINFTNMDPIKALVYTAVINGFVAVPILFAIIRIANDRKILGDKTNKRTSNILEWTAFVIMAASVIIMFLTWGS